MPTRGQSEPGKVRDEKDGEPSEGGEQKVEKDEAEWFNELDGKGFLNSEGISNRAIPPSDSFPATRNPEISNFSRLGAPRARRSS